MTKIEILLERAKEFYNNGDPAHDYNHVMRVVANCRHFAASVNADLEILLPAAVLHDLVNLPKNHPERAAASKMAAEKAKSLLLELNYSNEQINKIENVIIEHSYSLGKRPSSIESAILQDADKLDALGAIGILRMATVGAKMGTSYYNLAEPFAKTRELNDKVFSIDHFYTKLFKLPDLMNTEVAKDEGRKRMQFMMSFLKQFEGEILGK